MAKRRAASVAKTAAVQKEKPPVVQEPTEADRLAEPVDNEQPPRLAFPVVGIGASAGGLEAFTDFFDVMPADSGMAFVLIQHLPPQRESLMAEILSKHASMPVAEVEDGMEIEPDHVYVIRPGHTLTIKGGRLRLGQSLEAPGHSRPVDDFFKSLAEEQRERAIGVIMSGMGSNGTAGAQAIKAVGGVCIAQDPESAKFPSMPRHLIDSSAADFILRPQEIPEILKRYARHPYASDGRRNIETLLQDERQQFNEIIAVLRTRMRHDFSGYKKPTSLRRIHRRMGLNQVTRLTDYAKLLRQNPAEVTALSDDLMIHVTGFFRDPEVWEALRKQVITPLVTDRNGDGQIRCWVTACSTGEEAYTLAMLLTEAAEATEKPLDIKIFATDTAERTLSQARNGIYPGGIEAEITPERLAKYFEKDDSVYRIKKELRELVVFAPQNVLSDPPFSRLDIVTCRNLLIYLEPEIQKRVLSMIHFGLREGGALMLGTSETVTGTDELFEPIDKKLRIYRRVGPTRHPPLEFPVHTIFRGSNAGSEKSEQRAASRATIFQLTNKVLMDDFTPAAVVIDRQHRIVYFHGATELFLAQPRGEPTRELMAMVRENVRGAVRTALHVAMSTNESASAMDGFVESKERGRRRIVVKAAPLDKSAAPGHYIISFEERSELPPVKEDGDGSNSVEKYQEDLRRVREELQSTIEELQTSNEELKASNEEVTSVNEELQSTNEELETSKEELQSLNEELTTVNAQLTTKMDELEGTTNDLTSLLSSTDIGVIFLDTKLHIRRCTPAVRDLLEMIPGDVGRPLSDLATKFADPNLMADVHQVLAKLTPIGREVVSETGRWYLRRVLPYRTIDNRIDGVVITFVEISDRKNVEESLRQSKVAAESATVLKDEFLATLSHELRTPLSAIFLWARMLREKTTNPAQIIEGLKVIERSAEAQRSLIDDLLDSTRITAGKLRLEFREVELVNLIQIAVNAIAPAAQTKGVSMESKLQPEVGSVLADADRLRQVVWNLLNNAVKFTPAGGKVSVDMQRLGDQVEIRVSDTGQGISPEFISSLFAPFRQADSTLTRRHGGLGLGLAISKALVELHGGSIEAKSDGVDRGATFIVRLPFPRIPQSSGLANADASAEPAIDSGNSQLSGTRVLLVEDDDETRNAISNLLNRAGLMVMAVSAAKEAAEAYRRSPPDIIVSDLGMPDMDGWELLRQIRQFETLNRTKLVPAIALTALARDGDRERTLAAGFQGHLCKPVAAQQLLSALANLVGRQSGRPVHA